MQTRLKIDNDLATGKDKGYGYSSGVMREVAARTSAHDGWGQDGEPGCCGRCGAGWGAGACRPST